MIKIKSLGNQTSNIDYGIYYVCLLNRKRQKKAKSQQMIVDPYYHDKASIYTRASNAPYDNFTMMKPSTTHSLVGTQRMVMSPMGEVSYDNPAYGPTLGSTISKYNFN